jgi:DNA-binding transcriptional ArsR family regulator
MDRAGSHLLDAPQAVFDALADPTRRHLLERLVERAEPVSITDLTGAFPITRQAISKHLGRLEAAGLVRAERRGRECLVTFAPEPLDRAAAWIAELEARWDARLSALQQMLRDEVDAAAGQATRTEPQ